MFPRLAWSPCRSRPLCPPTRLAPSPLLLRLVRLLPFLLLLAVCRARVPPLPHLVLKIRRTPQKKHTNPIGIHLPHLLLPSETSTSCPDGSWTTVVHGSKSAIGCELTCFRPELCKPESKLAFAHCAALMSKKEKAQQGTRKRV